MSFNLVQFSTVSRGLHWQIKFAQESRLHLLMKTREELQVLVKHFTTFILSSHVSVYLSQTVFPLFTPAQFLICGFQYFLNGTATYSCVDTLVLHHSRVVLTMVA